jgi:hypothetical protein
MERERNTGKYAYSVERACKCGHTLGDHSAERVKWEGQTLQECFADACACECFKPGDAK